MGISQRRSEQKMVKTNPVPLWNFFDTLGKVKDNQEVKIWKKRKETQEKADTKEIHWWRWYKWQKV